MLYIVLKENRAIEQNYLIKASEYLKNELEERFSGNKMNATFIDNVVKLGNYL